MQRAEFQARGYRFINGVFQNFAGEAPEGRGSYRQNIIRYGDTSPEAVRKKAVFVLGQMEARMQALGFAWPDTTVTQVYTVHDIHAFLADEIVHRGAARSGITWHFNRPPVIGLDYEMDCRDVMDERIISWIDPAAADQDT